MLRFFIGTICKGLRLTSCNSFLFQSYGKDLKSPVVWSKSFKGVKLGCGSASLSPGGVYT